MGCFFEKLFIQKIETSSKILLKSTASRLKILFLAFSKKILSLSKKVVKTLVINNLSAEDLQLLLRLCERLGWDCIELPEKTTAENEPTDSQYSDKTYDELLDILLQKRMSEEMTPSDKADVEIENVILSFRNEKYGKKN
jgi:hypothetical protein